MNDNTSYTNESATTEQYIVLTNISNILDLSSNYGYWQTYLFNKETEEYEPIYDRFIFYKGKFFDNLESKPWSEDAIEQVKLLCNYMNRNNEPICIFRLEKKF